MSTILKKIAKDKKAINSGNAIIVKVDSVHSRIIGKLPYSATKRIDKRLSYWVPGSEFSPAYKKHIWDGYIRLFSARTQSFPTGFFKDVIKILTKREIKFEVEDLRPQIKISKESIEKAISFNKNITPRPYQTKALKATLEGKVGIVNIPTGTGKTLIINLIIRAIDIEFEKHNKEAKHLIITSGLTLLNQLKDEIEAFQKTKVGFIGEQKLDIQRITVASIDTLHRVLTYKASFSKQANKIEKDARNIEKRALITDLVGDATAIFLDEAHHSPAKTFKDVMYRSRAPFRIGTTATYKRSGGDDMMLQAVTGKVLFKRSISWMIRKGYLAKPTIILLEFNGKEKSIAEINKRYKEIMASKGKKYTDKRIKDMKLWTKLLSVEIAHNDKRNKLLAKVLKLFHEVNLSTILFINEKTHGTYLRSRAVDNLGIPEKELEFLSGKDDVTEIRKPVLKAFQTGKIRTIICTKIFNEGVNFPEANAGIKGGGLRYEGSIIQQLGRLLRKVKDPLAKDINRKVLQRVFWLDICDYQNSILAKHSLERIKTYESEEEFDVRYASNLKEVKQIIKENIKGTRIIKR